MPSRKTNAADINTRSPRGQRETQRARLIEGMLAVANRDGYAAATVSAVIAHAGVSRPTFYEYFADKDACFLATHRDIAESLLAQIRDAVGRAPPEHAPQAAIRRLLERAEAEPARAQFLANDALAGGPRTLDERDRTIAEVERLIEDARAGAPARASSPDLPTKALIGATHWLLAQRLRRSEHDLTQLTDELIGWIETYNRPVGKHRWRTLQPGTPPGPSPHVSEIPTTAPPPIPSGRTSLNKSEIAQNQRWRILFATAETAAAKGYTAATVTDIAKVARVDKRIFYKHFRDKQQAFLAVHELAFQQAMAVAASGFFSATEWPERVWRGIHAASQFQGSHASIAHMGFVESHALGPTAIQLIENNHAAFTIFLQEGSQHAATPPPTIAPQAIAAAIYEIGYQQTRHANPHHLTRMAWHAAYLALTPYLGPEATNRLIDEKLRR
jgi:AcrR family transcriptional regulator